MTPIRRLAFRVGVPGGDAGSVEGLPSEVEAGEVFSEAVGVVGDLAGLAGGGEELAASFGEGGGLLTYAKNFLELDAVEVVEGFELGGGEVVGRDGVN